MICHYFEETSYLIFASDVPPLLYYSHIPVIAIALIVGLFVFLNEPKLKLNRLLLTISVIFSAWTFINLIAWTNINSQLLLGIWPFFAVFSSLLAIYTIYFVRVFATGKDISGDMKWILTLLVLPVLILASTNLSVSGFNISDCDAFGFEGEIYNLYIMVLGVVAMLWAAYDLIRAYTKATVLRKKQILLMGIGVELFLAMFFFFTYIGSYLANAGHTTDSDIEFYGLFGMAFFMAIMGVLIVKFKSFSVGASASTALILALLILTASQFTYVESRTGLGVTAVTMVLSGILAIVLLRSVRKEISQRKQLEELTGDLGRANTRLKELDKIKSEFVSIASHQLRSPITSIRGYTSMLLEGSFGKFPEKANQALGRIDASAKHMTVAIEDYLNVSRIEAGNMKYELSDFNFKDEMSSVCEDVRPAALKEGLVLLFRSDLKGRAIVNADLNKTVQIAHNLINNSVKYTKKGSITVFMRDDIKQKRIYMDIIDTGVGMSQETLHTIFEKFGRAKDASKTNTAGTGLGLFVALKMAQAMGGTITAHSEGEGKGSRFTLELPLQM